MNKIRRLRKVTFEKSIKKKKGKTKIRLKIEKINEKLKTDSLNNTFFWLTAAPAEKSAEIREKIYH